MKLSNYSLKTLGLLAGLAFMASACDESTEDDMAAGGSTITVDGVTATLSSGTITDYGAGSSHWNYDFYITSAGDELAVYTELYSPGTTEFQTGTFTFASTAPSDTDFYFDASCDVGVDTDGDGDVDTFYDATGGTVTVSGTFPDYTVTSNITYDGLGEVAYTFTGTFSYIDFTSFTVSEVEISKIEHTR